MEDKTLFLKCSYRNQIVEIRIDAQDRLLPLSLSIYSSFNAEKMSLWTRLRWIWKVLRTGRPYNDQVLLLKPEADQLRDFLIKNEP